MNIEENDIIQIAESSNLTMIEKTDWFNFEIEKSDHSFNVKILKSGQYIFISLLVGVKEFPIEHIEFYMKETKSEILDELEQILIRLKLNDTRYSNSKSWFKKKMIAEINESNNWVRFGYPGTEIKKRAST